jgi:hypothetical protein
MCSPSPPPAPDYAGAAQQQGQANLAAARLQTQLNRPNQITPWGTQTWYQGQYPQGTGSATTPAPTGGAPTGPNVPTPRIGGGSPYGLGGPSGQGGTTPAGGAPNPSNAPPYGNSDQWTSVIQLAPEQQKLLDTQNQISQSLGNTGLSGLNRVGQAMQTPFSTAGMPALAGAPTPGQIQTGFQGTNVTNQIPGIGSISDLQDKATNAAMSRQTQQLDQQQQSLQAQLANQGITPGSEAYNRAMQPLQQARVDAQNQAFLTGTTYANQLFGQGLQQGQFANQAAGQQYGQNLNTGQFYNTAQNQAFNQGLAGNQFGNQARQQAIGEEAYMRQLPLNELNALRTGSQVQAPTFTQYNNAGQVAPPPIFGAAQAQGLANQQQYGNQVGSSNSMLSGLFGLGGSAIMGAGNAGGFSNLFSDRRLKRNVRRLGTHRGTPWYYFEYIWGEPSVGVMADEAPADAVRMDASGFAMVDYSRL